MSDADLVRRARRGDRDAFAALVARHDATLRRACTRALRDADLAADAAQEAVVAAMLSLDRLRDDERFGAWLVGIGLNTCRHLIRDRRTEALAGEPFDSPDLDAALDGARAAARIRRAIAALPAGQREAVELFYLSGLTVAETAEHLGVPPGAVKTRLHKARGTLRRRLEPVWKEQFAMSEATLVPVTVADVRRAGERHAVILAEDGGQRRLTIWVGPPEAIAIATELEGVELPRPGTHHLSAALLRATGTSVREVRITRLADSVFYAEVVLGGGESVDARPSDGIALALHTGAPLLLAGELLEATPPDELQAEMDAATDDRRVLAGETREQLARQAEEIARLSRP